MSIVTKTIPDLLELIRITTHQLILTCGIVINVTKTILHHPELFKITTYQLLIHDIVSIVTKTIPDLLESLIRITIYQLIPAYGIVSSIPYLLKHLTGLNTNRGHCVVISIARNGGSTTTSNVFCRNIDNSRSGEGEPFQLRKLENRSFWTNEEVTNNGLTAGCLLEYQDGMCCQSLLGRLHKLAKQDGKQIIFCRNLGGKPLVSFHCYTNNTFVSRFLRNLHCPNRSIRIPPPPLTDLDLPAKLPVFQFSLIFSNMSLCKFFFLLFFL